MDVAHRPHGFHHSPSKRHQCRGVIRPWLWRPQRLPVRALIVCRRSWQCATEMRPLDALHKVSPDGNGVGGL